MDQNLQDIDEHLLLQYILGNADEALQASVAAWLEAGSGNRKHLDQLESLWLETGRLSPPPVAVDTDAAWSGISERMAAFEERTTNGERDRTGGIMEKSANGTGNTIPLNPSRYWWRAAAMILLLIGMYSIYWFFHRPEKQIELVSGSVVLHDTLPDGSEVALNQGSKLIFSEKFSNVGRSVKLSGEAFFEVKRDAAHPFIVNAGPACIRVLGTSFRVKTDAPHEEGTIPSGWGDPLRLVELTVVEGRVMLFTVGKKSGDTAAIILQAGETGILKAGCEKPEMAVPSVPDEIFWANRSLDFRGTALREVLTLLQKYYPVSISVSDEAILECRLTASFADEPVSSILNVIAESFGLSLETRGQNFLLSGHGCGRE